MAASLFECIAAARQTLVTAGVGALDAPLDAEVLARHVLGWDRATLLIRGREAPPAGFAERFQSVIQRRTQHEPVAQIVGHREFWELEFEVTRDVLVPRPETELIVEVALEIVDRTRQLTILDVGTGTGCLAVSLAVELPAARLTASDISPAALAVARRNAERHGVVDRIRFIQSNLLDGVEDPFDLIVSNPPYVPSGDTLPRDVAEYEPHQALFSGPDGLDALRVLIAGGLACLAPEGAMIVEFGFGQANTVRSLAAADGWRVMSIRADLQGIERVGCFLL
jgi:release factor glutamine methyltransferase